MKSHCLRWWKRTDNMLLSAPPPSFINLSYHFCPSLLPYEGYISTLFLLCRVISSIVRYEMLKLICNCLCSCSARSNGLCKAIGIPGEPVFSTAMYPHTKHAYSICHVWEWDLLVWVVWDKCGKTTSFTQGFDNVIVSLGTLATKSVKSGPVKRADLVAVITELGFVWFEETEQEPCLGFFLFLFFSFSPGASVMSVLA